MFDIFSDNDYPGDYCCNFFDLQKEMGQVYQGCISEKGEGRAKVATEGYKWDEKVFYVSCGERVAHEIC